MTDSDWANVPSPLLLDRNFTLAGVFDDPNQWPLLDLGFVADRIILAPGVVFNVTRLALERWRQVPHFQAYGFDIFVAANGPAYVTSPAFFVLYRAAVIQRTCLPAAVAPSSTSSSARAAAVPGKQIAYRLPSNQTNCSNSSSVPAMQRCWLVRGVYQDTAAVSSSIDALSHITRAGYITRCLNTSYLCSTVMSEECAAALGPVGCFYSMFPRIQPSPSQVAPTAPPSKSNRRSMVAGLLAGILGGSAGLACIAGAGILVWRMKGRLGGAARRVAVGRAPPANGLDGAFDEIGPSFQGMKVRVEASTCDSLGPPHSLHNTAADAASEAEKGGKDAGHAPPAAAVPSPPGVMHVGKGEGAAKDTTAQGISTATLVAEQTSDLELVPVTPLTPLRSCVNLDMAAGEVKLSSTILGKGAHGRVVVGTYGGQPVAVKLINTGLVLSSPMDAVLWATVALSAVRDSAGLHESAADAAPTGNADSAGESEAINATGRAFGCEVAVLARCQHPNVVRLLAASLTPPRVGLVMELMDTSLERMLYSTPAGSGPEGPHDAPSPTLLPLEKVLHIAMQVARALAYLHPTVIHRDLKPANVLISKADSDHPIAKLADFGLSRLASTVLMTRNPEVGTAPYMAPEVFDPENFEVTDRSDIYAFGVILWEMLSGHQPWVGCSIVQIAVAVATRGERLPLGAISPDRCPRKLESLIRACWEQDPARRPAAAEVVKGLALVQEALRQASANQPARDGEVAELAGVQQSEAVSQAAANQVGQLN